VIVSNDATFWKRIFIWSTLAGQWMDLV